LTNSEPHDIVADMQISSGTALKLFPMVVPPSRLLQSSTRTRKTAKEQPATWLFFRSPNRRRPGISADNVISQADNLLQRTAKTARTPCPHHVFGCALRIL
jgi:hypothetical protein